MRIAITGKMCSGKSTLANKIAERDPRFQIFSFGSKVKDIAKDLFNMTEKDRSLLVNIGSKMREIDPDVWTKYVLKQTEGLTHCIVDDLRYQNEYEALSNAGFKIIQLVISEETQGERIKKIYPNKYQDHFKNRSHSSEKNTFNWLPENEPLVINSEEESITNIMLKKYFFSTPH
jgi:dephospho-CoA kinase